MAEQRLVYRLIVSNAIFRRMAFRFVAGDRLEDAIAAVKRLNAQGIKATLDCLGEDVKNEAEAAHAAQDYLRALDDIEANRLDCNVSLKLTQMGLGLGPATCLTHLRSILEKARGYNNFVRIDMEGSALTQVTLDMFKELWTDYQNVGVVIQSYLLRSEQDIAMLNQMGARVRLCKGAYSEPPGVAFADKTDVDNNYRRLAERLLTEGTYPGLATHDGAIIEYLQKFTRDHKIDNSRFEFQMLYGIRRQLQEELVRQGYNLRVYVPYGTQWYPYFMRRLAERPANLLFFLTALFRG
jgi:proline dehydrogenase